MATVGSLAAFVDGKVIGDPDREIQDVADLQSAGPTDISFLSNPKYMRQFEATRAGAVLVTKAVDPALCALVVCDNPYLAMARIAVELHPPPSWPAGVEVAAHVSSDAQVDPTATIRVGAVVDAEARIGPRTLIGAGCYVGSGARIGADVLLHPGAKVLDRCILDDRVILQAGAVIGSDGFGYAPSDGGKRHKIPQVGIVHLESGVEIGANCTVDRATFGVTRIGSGSKIDNLVQIAHNVVTGSDCVVVSQSGIAGSTTLGDRVVIGAQAGIVGHVHITDDVMLGARSGVPNDIKSAGIYSGAPTMPHRDWLKMIMAQQAVPELRRRVRALEKKLETLEA
ncbi:MAG: UDP-3-O-(3-hydroxymyristoyl)glucosamine N-acyltransferase [Myxococcota bacterium]